MLQARPLKMVVRVITSKDYITDILIWVEILNFVICYLYLMRRLKTNFSGDYEEIVQNIMSMLSFGMDYYYLQVMISES